MNKDYEIHYLPLFQDDLMKTVYYISNILENPDAALKLVDDVEKVILKRSQNPLSFEPFRSKHKRKHSYYRIYIRNYVIFYVVNEKNLFLKSRFFFVLQKRIRIWRCI